MTQTELEKIELKIKSKIRKIAGNTGYGYLNCYNNQWKDGGDYIHKISEMDTKYLKRCLRTVTDSNYGINPHFDAINEVIKIVETNLTNVDKDKIIDKTREYLHELHNEKIECIENELASR